MSTNKFNFKFSLEIIGKTVNLMVTELSGMKNGYERINFKDIGIEIAGDSSHIYDYSVGIAKCDKVISIEMYDIEEARSFEFKLKSALAKFIKLHTVSDRLIADYVNAINIKIHDTKVNELY